MGGGGGGGEEVVLLDYLVSMFGMRVRIALAEKGIQYEYREEDLSNKSPLLLEMNPVHKKIPVLIHDGKPVCESLIAVQYIDEVWKDTAPLFSSDPHQNAEARFWADYVEKQVHSAGSNILFSTKENQEAAKKEFIEKMKVLEGVVGDKPYFGGHTFGFLDVALIPYYSWFDTYETFGGFSVEAECPVLVAWAKRCMLRESVAKTLPHPSKVYDYIVQRRKLLGLA